jgi:hypothetical protein
MFTTLVLSVALTAPAEPGAGDRARVKAALALASASQRSAPAPVGACGNPSCTCGCRSGEVCRCAEKNPGKVIAQSTNGWRWNAEGRYWWKPVSEATPEELAKYGQRVHVTPSVQHVPVQQTWTPIPYTEVIPEGTRRWEQSTFVPAPTYSAPARFSGSGC